MLLFFLLLTTSVSFLYYFIFHKEFLLDNKLSPADINRKKDYNPNLPPPFPNGWYVICHTSRLGNGEVMPFRIFGKQLAVFRTEGGEISAIDAYCPHLGADLSEGVVSGDRIVCPFHAWEIGADGQCKRIPYLTKGGIPSGAKVSRWHCEEINNLVMIWFDAEERPPMWRPPKLSDYELSLPFRGRIIHYILNHIISIAENGADIAHFTFVHDLSKSVGNSTHRWIGKIVSSNWQLVSSYKPDGPLARASMIFELKLFGFMVPIMRQNIDIVQVGPGIVHLHTDSPMTGKMIMIQSVVPEEANKNIMTHYGFGYNLPTKIMLASTSHAVNEDVKVWNRMNYRKKPLLTSDESSMAIYRRWYNKSFYSENSHDPFPDKLDW